MEFRWLEPTHPDFTALTQELDDYFHAALGQKQFAFDPHNVAETLSAAAVIYHQQQPVACGALKLYPNGIAELKRIYVKPEYRSGGLATRMVLLLQEKAVQSGCSRMVLETNPAFTSAVALYRRLGFEQAENYGPYVGICTLCMAKTLSQAAINPPQALEW